MFGGSDPFSHMFGEMHNTMREMDRMMNTMMDPFGFMGRPPMGMIGHVPTPHQAPRMLPGGMMRRDPFGFPDIFSQMHGLADMAMNDPNSVCYTQSTMISMDPSGRPRVVEHSTRKSGDVQETRRHVRDGEEEEMRIGHTIGEREHVMEKKRDKDGKVRRNQTFRGIDQSEAEAFDREFSQRAARNMRESPYSALYGYGRRDREALPGAYSRRSGESRRLPQAPRNESSTSSAPIITLPDDDDFDGPSYSSSRRAGSTGPIIREISDEEAEQSIPKRRKDMTGRFNARDA